MPMRFAIVMKFAKDLIVAMSWRQDHNKGNRRHVYNLQPISSQNVSSYSHTFRMCTMKWWHGFRFWVSSSILNLSPRFTSCRCHPMVPARRNMTGVVLFCSLFLVRPWVDLLIFFMSLVARDHWGVGSDIQLAVVFLSGSTVSRKRCQPNHPFLEYEHEESQLNLGNHRQSSLLEASIPCTFQA